MVNQNRINENENKINHSLLNNIKKKVIQIYKKLVLD